MAITDKVEKFREFIDLYCQKELNDTIKKGRPNIYIDFSKLNRFNTELAEALLNTPSEAFEAFEEAVKQANTLENDRTIKVRIRNLPKTTHIKIKDLRSKHLGSLISVEGLIRQASDIRPQTTLTTFECPGCNSQILVAQTDSKLKEPARCNQCSRKGRFRRKEDKLVDVQGIVLEESPESLEGGEQPKRIRAIMSEDLLDPKFEKRKYPGNNINVAGILKEVPINTRTGAPSTKYDLIIEINSIETIIEEFADLEIKKEDEKVIKELSQAPNVHELFINSVAPSIYGYPKVKEAIVLQLFGGVKKKKSDGTQLRGDIHLFLVGDPGAGKSILLRYVTDLAPKARYVAGRGASAAGITASVVKDEFMGGWTLEAGTLVLANKGIACIDELDKMTTEDSSSMHEAMEQQCFDYKTLIQFADGSERLIGDYIEELFKKHPNQIIKGKDCLILKDGVVKEKVLTTNWEKIFPTQITRVSKHLATKYLYKLNFTNGRSITVTPEHPVFCLENGKIITKRADEVTGGESVPIPLKLPIEGQEQVFSINQEDLYNPKATQHIKVPNHNDADLYRIIGYLLSEGSKEINRGKEIGFNFTNKDERLLDNMRICMDNVFGAKCYAQIKVDNHEPRTMLRYISRELAKFFELELAGVLNKSDKKRIPDNIMQGKKEDLSQLLLTIFEGDGHVVMKERTLRIGYTSKSQKLVEQLQDLLLRFGIQSSITHHKNSYKINITGHENIKLFAKEINFIHPPRKAKVKQYLDEKEPIRTFKRVIPNCGARIIELMNKYNISIVGKNNRATMKHDYIKKKKGISRLHLQKLVNILKEKDILKEDEEHIKFLEKMAFGEIGYEKIKSTEKIRSNHPWTYDITIEPNHTFISQGAVLHNTVSISKANIQATLRTETSVLAAANPKFGRFDPYSPIPNQINMPSSLLNRFDLIFTFRDVPNKKADEALAIHVLDLQGDIESKKGDIDRDLLRKYVAYARKNCNPILTAQAKDEIRKYYVKLRNSAGADGGDVKSIPISPRQLQALVRLAEASAKIRLSKKVSKEDAQRAINLLNSCMAEVGTDPETGKFDVDMITSGISATKRNRISTIKKIIDDLATKFGKQIPIAEIISAAEGAGLEKDNIEEIIKNLKRQGDIFEPKQGMIQKVN